MSELKLTKDELRNYIYIKYPCVFNLFKYNIHKRNKIIEYFDNILLQDDIRPIFFLYKFLLDLHKNIILGIKNKFLLNLFFKKISLPIDISQYIFSFDPYLMNKNYMSDFIFSLFFIKYKNNIISEFTTIYSGFKNSLAISREININDFIVDKDIWIDLCVCTFCGKYNEIFNTSEGIYISKEYNNCVKCNCFCDICGEIKKNIYVNSIKNQNICMCKN